MNKQDVAAFFDRLAPGWDENDLPEGRILEKILDTARLRAGERVLDVGCGTGVLFPHYLRRGVLVTGVDLSGEMARRAAEKYAGDRRVTVLCADAETLPPGDFDAVMVHNALPHFPDPAAMIAALSRQLRPLGRLTVAHSASRAVINQCHRGAASGVSRGLPAAGELAELFAPYFLVDTLIDNKEMYLVSGVLREKELPVDKSDKS